MTAMKQIGLLKGLTIYVPLVIELNVECDGQKVDKKGWINLIRDLFFYLRSPLYIIRFHMIVKLVNLDN